MKFTSVNSCFMGNLYWVFCTCAYSVTEPGTRLVYDGSIWALTAGQAILCSTRHIGEGSILARFTPWILPCGARYRDTKPRRASVALTAGSIQRTVVTLPAFTLGVVRKVTRARHKLISMTPWTWHATSSVARFWWIGYIFVTLVTNGVVSVCTSRLDSPPQGAL